MVRLPLQTADAEGPVQVRYELVTNDPAMPVISLTVAAVVKPIPPFVRRIENSDIIKGDWIGAFKIWPTPHPRITLARGETLSFSLRIWSDQPTGAQAGIMDNPTVGAQDASNGADGRKLSPLPRGALTVTVRPGSTDRIYWLDVKIGPIESPGSFLSPLIVPRGHKKLSALTSLDVFVVVRPHS